MDQQRQEYEDKINQSDDAIRAAQEEQRRHTEEYRRQRQADEARAACLAQEYREKMSTLSDRGSERQDYDQGYQQQLADFKAAAEEQQRRWAHQEENDRQERQRLERERDEYRRKQAALEKEANKSKGFFLGAVRAVCKVVGLAFTLTGFAAGLAF
jgi:hypothetical protein